MFKTFPNERLFRNRPRVGTTRSNDDNKLSETTRVEITRSKISKDYCVG